MTHGSNRGDSIRVPVLSLFPSLRTQGDLKRFGLPFSLSTTEAHRYHSHRQSSLKAVPLPYEMAGPSVSVSFIPGPAGSATPRKGSSNLPSSASTPFAPFSTMPRVASTPATSNNINSTSGSGIPKFRALRNMLPFGPKQSSTPTSPSVPPSAMSTRGTLIHRRSSSSIPASSSSTQISPLPPPLPLPASDDEGVSVPDRRTRAFLTLGPKASSFAAAFSRAGIVDRSRPPLPTTSNNMLPGPAGSPDAKVPSVASRSHSEDLDVGWRGNPSITQRSRASVDVVNISGTSNLNKVGSVTRSGLLLPDDPFRKTLLTGEHALYGSRCTSH